MAVLDAGLIKDHVTAQGWHRRYFNALYSTEHLHLPVQKNMLFAKSRVGPSGYMALPHKQMSCQNLAVLWVRKQFLA
jgi:hypothetical protein